MDNEGSKAEDNNEGGKGKERKEENFSPVLVPFYPCHYSPFLFFRFSFYPMTRFPVRREPLAHCCEHLCLGNRCLPTMILACRL